MMYLVQYRFNGEFKATVMGIHPLAGMIVHSDGGEFEVYRLVPDKAPEKLRYSVCNGILWLEDKYGNPVDHCDGEHHNRVGRPRTTAGNIPKTFRKHYQAFLEGNMNVSELARVCGLSRPTVYKYMKLIG